MFMERTLPQEFLAAFGLTDRSAVSHAAGQNGFKQMLWLESRVRHEIVGNRPSYYQCSKLASNIKKRADKYLGNVAQSLKKYIGMMQEKIEKRNSASVGRKVKFASAKEFAAFFEWSDMNKLKKIKQIKKNEALDALTKEVLMSFAIFQAWLRGIIKDIASELHGKHTMLWCKVKRRLDPILARRTNKYTYPYRNLIKNIS